MAEMLEMLKQNVYCIIIIAAILFIAFFVGPLIDYSRRKNITKYRKELRNILKNDNEAKRYEKLKELAKEVGAGYVNTKIASTSTSKTDRAIETSIYQNPISESELVLNINNALQTDTMIDMCKTAARNLWIAVIAMIAAVVSALAAWWANVE